MFCATPLTIFQSSRFKILINNKKKDSSFVASSKLVDETERRSNFFYALVKMFAFEKLYRT